MKIALIGNMNNNHFALMRYFRDLGVDANLFLYSNDGVGGLDHFSPSCDTWNLDRWQPFIHQTNISNAPISAFNFPLSIFFSINYFLKKVTGPFSERISSPWPISIKYLNDVFCDFEFLIGTGIAPALLQRVNRSLDIFSPYGTGIEYFKNTEFISQLNSLRGFKRYLMQKIQCLQISGLQQSRFVLDADHTIAFAALQKIGVKPIPLSIPMVYDAEPLPCEPPTAVLWDASALIADSGFSLLHHSRLMWVKTDQFSEAQWLYQNKNNNALIRSFARLVAMRPALKPTLLIVEYGIDVGATKKLIADLGITAQVHWLPKMARRELMWLLSRVSVGVGEFYDVPRTIWGGTGWETLASGKPLLQGFQFAEGEFEAIYGHPPPPMLPVWSQQNILPHLLDMADHPEKRDAIGQGAKAWFAEHNGIGLARKWLDLLLSTDRPSV